MNTIFVYLFMQEHFVDKIHFFKFLSMSDKPRLHQLKIISSSRSSTVQASLIAWMFSSVRGNTIKEGKISYVELKYKTSSTYQALWEAITVLSEHFFFIFGGYFMIVCWFLFLLWSFFIISFGYKFILYDYSIMLGDFLIILCSSVMMVCSNFNILCGNMIVLCS